jgi:hypothetical protein
MKSQIMANQAVNPDTIPCIGRVTQNIWRMDAVPRPISIVIDLVDPKH